MTNNDDFNQPEFEPTEELPPPGGVRANLAEAWRSRPLFKLVVLMTAVGAIVAASVSLFSGGSSSTNNSRIVKPPEMHEVPGGPVSPYMAQQTNLADSQRTKDAIATGGSALPTPMGQTTGIGDLDATEKKNDPLNELKAELEHLRQQQQQQQQQVQQQVQKVQQIQQVQQKQEPFDDSLAQAMQRQMSQLTDSWTPHGVKDVVVTRPEDEKAAAASATAANTAANAAATAAAQPQPKILVTAGTVSYAQLLTEANSDVPGPILAQIVSGPLSGARAVGSFEVANGYSDYLVLQFRVADLKGQDYPINAIALDPDTTLGGMATEVDERYFTRVILPAAAGFIQGFGQGMAQNSATTTTNGTSTIIASPKPGITQGIAQGFSQGAQAMSQFFQNQANVTRPLVRVAAGTAMGMFFVTSVQDTTVQQIQEQRAAAGIGGPLAGLGYPGGYGYPGAGGFSGATGLYPGASGYGANPYASGPYAGTGYPGTTITGYGGQTAGSSVPYPNYAAPASPYGLGTPTSQGLGTTIYRP